MLSGELDENKEQGHASDYAEHVLFRLCLFKCPNRHPYQLNNFEYEIVLKCCVINDTDCLGTTVTANNAASCC